MHIVYRTTEARCEEGKENRVRIRRTGSHEGE